MNIQVRPYHIACDYKRVYDFLDNTFTSAGPYSNWPPPRWEYMHYHPFLKAEYLSRIGIWEHLDQIVGVVNYEDDLQDVYLQVHPLYPFLKEDMVDYAERNLYSLHEEKKGFIRIFANDFDSALLEIIQKKGYIKDESHPEWYTISEYSVSGAFPETRLPEGFRLKSLAEDNDLTKIGRCIWRGFNHQGELPDDDMDDRKLMQSAPNFQKDLNIVVEAENGQFVSYSGIWMIQNHRSSYVEPVATDPEYRKKGLGEAVVLECIRRCAAKGVKRAIVESGIPFYLRIGFKPIFSRFPWTKQCKAC